MTTIAWDGMTLAGDRQATWGGTPTLTTKVFKVKIGKKKYLVGAAGNTGDCQAFVDFVKGGFKGEPKYQEFTGIAIDQSGCMRVYSENPNPCVLNPKFWAIGSGGDYALGAMAHGATAAEAVLIATELDVNTGLGVDTVSF
jgi:ATP-dependent protease HslVU (ClpYQ) peptidase subunit